MRAWWVFTFEQNRSHLQVRVDLVLYVLAVLLVEGLDEPRADVHVKAVGEDELDPHGNVLGTSLLRHRAHSLLGLDGHVWHHADPLHVFRDQGVHREITVGSDYRLVVDVLP